MNRTERLLDLITYLLNAHEPISWQEIKNHFPDDYARGVEESNQRKFERDKAELISLGIPIDYHSGAGAKKEGYIIEEEKLFLPEIEFTAQESSLLMLSASAVLENESFPYRDQLESALHKITSTNHQIGVVGLGYVGLSLSMELVRSGFRVHGIDIDGGKVEQMNRGESLVQDVAGPILKAAVDSGQFRAYQDYEVVSRVDCVIICVPTPLRQTKDPDISCIMDATREIRRYLHNDMLIILESTTYPGTTEEVLSSELQSDRFKVGKDLFLAFSPERADPGNSDYDTKNTPKIVGGITAECTQMAKILYEQIIDKVITVSSTATAEMVKLLENTFRAVNIGLVNEIAIVCDKLGVSVWEVIEAAATKPFGFMPFFPGPGLGGHCIPIDPLYLSWKLKMLNYNARFIELASEVNTQMPEYCLNRIARLLNQHQRSVNGTSILILGVTYKRDVNDVRESPALDIIRLLENDGAKVAYCDPYVSCLRVDGFAKKSIQLTPETVKQYDLVVLVTDHSCFDYEMIQRSANLIFDTRNSFKEPLAKVSRL